MDAKEYKTKELLKRFLPYYRNHVGTVVYLKIIITSYGNQ